MAVIAAQDVHKTYRDQHLLRGVSLHVEALEHVGLLGPNGSGKSTLLRILAGAEVPDTGERTVMREASIGYLPQDPVLDPARTVRAEVLAGVGGRAAVLSALDEVHRELAASPASDRIDALLRRQARLEDELAALGGHEVEHRAAEVLHRLGMRDAEALCGNLSGGEQRRVALARVLLAAPDVLLLDEPTNHLDAVATQWLEEWLAAARTTLLMVTHDRYFLDRVVDRIVEIDRGELHSYDGGYRDFLVQRAHRLEIEEKGEQTRRNLLRRETEWMRRGPPARTTKAKARIGRFHDLVDAAPESGPGDLALEIPPGPRLGDRVLELKNVRVAFGARAVLDDLSIAIGPGERVGIVGPNGAGKTTFLDVCTGVRVPDAGTVTRGPTVKLAGIDQGRRDLHPEKTVLQEVAGENDFVFVGGRPLRIESFLERMLFPGAMMRARIADLSGGERNRVLLAKLLRQGGNVLVLDEPTNDLDLMTLRVLEEALIAFPGTVLVVSHDRWFLDRVATRILYFAGDGRMRVHEGDLSLLLERMAREAAPPAPQRARTAAPDRPSGKSKRSTREERELAALPEQIAAAEQKLAAIDARLADPSLYADAGADVRAAVAERAAAQQAIEALYARWLELESARDA